MGSVVDIDLVVHQANAAHPVPRLFRIVRVCHVVCVSRQSCAEVEEYPVRNAVFVVIADVELRNLPAHPPTASVIVSFWCCLCIEDSLSQLEPARLARVRRVGKPRLGREHGGHAPKPLIIIAQRGRPVVGHVCVLWRAGLEDQRLHGRGNVRLVASVVPVVDHGSPQRAAFPPVVIAARGWTGEDAGDLPCEVSLVKRH